ncbi:MAG TPA: hypothetical protein DHV28_16275 [Ignavibacteriales bacterium]|nr:hypothetical protein [Ignavibacteriales bacterium]
MKTQNIYKIIENIGLQAKEFLILALPKLNDEPLKSLIRRFANRKINMVLVYCENDGNLIENKKYKWAKNCTFLKTENLAISYIISDKRAVTFRNENIIINKNLYYFLSKPYSDRYLANIHDLQKHINMGKAIYDFSKHLPLQNEKSMKWLHNKLLLKNAYDIENEYYDSTYILFCRKAKEIYPVLPDYIDFYLGRIIAKRWKLNDEIFNDLFDKLSESGTPYSFGKLE